MSENLKVLVSGFLKIPAEQINESTIIDRTAVKNSIMLHRMYARLKEENFAVSDYWDIRTFGDLLNKGNTNGSAGIIKDKISPAVGSEISSKPGIGIDIEDIAALPVVSDFRNDSFYQLNFSPAEISYCILQQNPYSSFAGLFAVKEALFKIDNTLKRSSFSDIQIHHLESGKPVYKNFEISISHTDNYAVAVAQLNPEFPRVEKNVQHAAPTPMPNKNSGSILLGVIALIISVVALILAYIKQ